MHIQPYNNNKFIAIENWKKNSVKKYIMKTNQFS